jgi:hypothetical protein
MGSLAPEPSRLERLAVLAGIDADELRELLREEIADAREELVQHWRAEQQGILAEAIAESSGEPR